MKNKTLKEVIHETAKEFYESGVMDEQTMREFDFMCLSKPSAAEELTHPAVSHPPTTILQNTK